KVRRLPSRGNDSFGRNPSAGARKGAVPMDGFRACGKRAAALPPETASLPAGPLEPFGGTGDDFILDVERQAEMAGAAETGTGHGKDAFIKELLDEGHVVAAGSLREEIKRALGHLEFIARVGEDVAHHFAAAGI